MLSGLNHQSVAECPQTAGHRAPGAAFGGGPGTFLGARGWLRPLTPCPTAGGGAAVRGARGARVDAGAAPHGGGGGGSGQEHQPAGGPRDAHRLRHPPGLVGTGIRIGIRVGIGMGTPPQLTPPAPFGSTEAFSPERGGREDATRLMIVVTDGESHDGDELPEALRECERRNITRYAIAVSPPPPFPRPTLIAGLRGGTRALPPPPPPHHHHH